MSGTPIVDLQERSDFDPHQSVQSQEDVLGEYLGEGFFLNMEPVLVQRDANGAIRRTVPLSEAMLMAEKMREEAAKLPPVEGRVKPVLHPLPTSEREKLAAILANRLFSWYDAQPPQVGKYNPIYDGIPEVPPEERAVFQPKPGAKLYPASRYQVYEWLKRVVASRVELVNRKSGKRGYKGDISDFTLRVHLSPGKE